MYVVFYFGRPSKLFYLPLALVLILCACLTFGSYSEALEKLNEIQGLDGEMESTAIMITTSLKLYIYAAPAVMLAIAANLITASLEAAATRRV